MFKSILLSTILTLTLSSCYTQFAIPSSSNNYDDDDTEYNNDEQCVEVNNYYSDGYGYLPYYPIYPVYPIYPYVPPGGGGGAYIYEGSGTNYSPIDKNPRNFDKGKSSRERSRRDRNSRSKNKGKSSRDMAAAKDRSSRNKDKGKVGRDIPSTDRNPRQFSGGEDNNTKFTDISNGGNVSTYTPTDKDINNSSKNRKKGVNRRHKKRKIHYSSKRYTASHSTKKTNNINRKNSRRSNNYSSFANISNESVSSYVPSYSSNHSSKVSSSGSSKRTVRSATRTRRHR